jgi:hypothetical protein
MNARHLRSGAYVPTVFTGAVYAACGFLCRPLGGNPCQYRAQAAGQVATYHAEGSHKPGTLPPSTLSLLHSMHKKRPCPLFSTYCFPVG